MYKKLKNELISWISDNPIQLDWYNADLSYVNNQILKDGLEKFMDELYSYNTDYFFESENGYFEYLESEFDIKLTEDDIEDLRTYIVHDLNMKSLFSKLPEMNFLLYGYSNYDCCNSFDNPYTDDPETYLGDVYKRINSGVRREDFAYEFYNGAYGGALFAFLFTGSVGDYLKIKDKINNSETITIPKGTEFGFHSSFQGACSLFEKKTWRTMTLKTNGLTKYDSWELEPDGRSGYGLKDICGMIPAETNILRIKAFSLTKVCDLQPTIS